MKENNTLTNDQQTTIFEEAMSIKLEQLRAKGDTKSDEEATIQMLADLQDKQDKEAANIMKDLDQKVNGWIRYLKGRKLSFCKI